MRNKAIKVILFALTGFGNTVLKALIENVNVHVAAVFTVKYENPFPYYTETQLIDLCDELGVNCYYGVKVSSNEGMELLRQLSPDLIIMATFKEILKENVIRLPSLGVINFHPSLLPRYRGPCPTNTALLDGEKSTGISVHYVTDKLDEGNILVKRTIPIEETDYDGQLRQKLAVLAGELVPEIIEMFSGKNRPSGIPQEHSLASYAPKPPIEDGYLEQSSDVEIIQRKMRAYNPLPGTSILTQDKRIPVNRYALIQDTRSDGVYENDNTIDVIINSKGIRLYKKVI